MVIRWKWVLVDGVVEGTVELIGFRSTFIRRFDKAPVLVPNAKLSDRAVTNFSRMTHRRIFWKIGVEYGTDVDQLRQICSALLDYVASNDGFEHSDECRPSRMWMRSTNPASTSCFTASPKPPTGANG